MSVEGPRLDNQPDNLYSQIVLQTQQKHQLFGVHWELTYRCNQRCSHCYLDVLPAGARVPSELTTDECLRVLDELATLGVLHLTLSGGEIFTRRDLFEIAEHARIKRFLVRLFTNGIAISAARADRIAALHPYAVEISVYGARAETHEKITQHPHSFALTLRAFRLLRERGVRTVLKTPLMHENVGEFRALQALAQDLGAQFRYDMTLTPKDGGDPAPLRHRLSDDERLNLFREVVDPAKWQAHRPALEQCTCNIGTNALLIDPYGAVFPCVQLRLAAGNVREQSVRTIWEQAPIWGELRRLTLSQLPVCRTCELNTVCVRCYGLAQLENGDLRAPVSINCAEAAARRQILAEKGVLATDLRITAHRNV